MRRKDQIDMTGFTSGDLVVIGPGDLHTRPNGSTLQKWECLCACGNLTQVLGNNLRQGSTKSCGCWRRKAGEGAVSRGYIHLYRPDHPNAWKNGLVAQHVVVMSELLGRPLIKGENVHHKNGNRSDNRPENLELWSTMQPAGKRIEDLVAYAREILNLYGAVRIK